jgi:hypothetical protein
MRQFSGPIPADHGLGGRVSWTWRVGRAVARAPRPRRLDQGACAAVRPGERMVTGGHTVRPTGCILATMFADIVGSLARASELGDSRRRALLDRHDDLVKDHVEAAGGHVVKMTGNGVASPPKCGDRRSRSRDLRHRIVARGRRAIAARPRRSCCLGRAAGAGSARYHTPAYGSDCSSQRPCRQRSRESSTPGICGRPSQTLARRGMRKAG